MVSGLPGDEVQSEHLCVRYDIQADPLGWRHTCGNELKVCDRGAPNSTSLASYSLTPGFSGARWSKDPADANRPQMVQGQPAHPGLVPLPAAQVSRRSDGDPGAFSN